jgi:phytoene desaturase
MRLVSKAKLKMNIGIVGAGVAGLASAIRLAAKGHHVEVFEANTYPGGKLTSLEWQGFRFDAGPSLFTLPQLVEELYEVAGQDPRAFEYMQLKQASNYFYEDGTRFTAYHDRQQLAQELQHKLGINPDQVMQYLDRAKHKYATTFPIFIEYSLHRFKNYLNANFVKGLLAIPSLDLFDSMNTVNEQTFSDPRLVQYFNRFATYNGSDPYQSPGVLTMIAHLEHNVGTFFPKRGMHGITQALCELGRLLGVQYHLGQPVSEILTKHRKVQGLRVGQERIPFDVVVSNMDITPTYRKLLPGIKPPEKILAQEKSSSALIFYWGINRQFAELDLHNVFFTANYPEEFDALFRQKALYHDPTVYVNITSKYKPDDAPAGQENWFVMLNAPQNVGQDWDAMIDVTRSNTLQKLSRMLGTDIAQHVVAEQILDPRSIEARTSSFGGSLYGNASNNRFAAFLRHKNFSSQLAGLYFCGGSVHPGGGIPLCLNSAKIVDRLIQEDYAL